MKSTQKLIDNLATDDFRKAKVDLKYATEHIMKKRVNDAKKVFVKELNDK